MTMSSVVNIKVIQTEIKLLSLAMSSITSSLKQTFEVNGAYKHDRYEKKSG